jgi:hypothetical protein
MGVSNTKIMHFILYLLVYKSSLSMDICKGCKTGPEETWDLRSPLIQAV